MKKRKLSEELRLHCLAERKKGIPVSKIAKEQKVAQSVVYKWVAEDRKEQEAAEQVASIPFPAVSVKGPTDVASIPLPTLSAEGLTKASVKKNESCRGHCAEAQQLRDCIVDLVLQIQQLKS